MELLKSKKFKLPKLFFISDRKEIKNLPLGVPFVYGNPNDKSRFIRMLEYEIIWKKAVATGYPFNWKKLLHDAGFRNVKFHSFCESIYIDCKDSGDYDIEKLNFSEKELYEGGDHSLFEDFVEDCSAYVDIAKLKQLNVFPTWLNDVEEAISTNIHNFAAYNPHMYNKKLEGMYGSIDLINPAKNLIIIDISASIPRAVGTTCLTLAKHLVETFYADLMVTGRETHLFSHEEIQNLDVEGMYDKFGQGNECKMYRELVTGESKKYTTAIVFGDNHSPCESWGYGSISRETAQKQCNWIVERMISLHTTSDTIRAGYGDFFNVKEVKHISNWVKYIEN